MARKTYNIAVIAGEESGQLLAADLIVELNKRLGQAANLLGVGGPTLQALGLKSIFNPDEIALTGISGVVKSLPKLMLRISQTSNAIIAENPDLLLLVDSPEFSLRVARKVKKALPNMPVVKYVAPSVWAWRPGRAQKMAAYIDHVLAILPFETKVMEELDGPKTHYIGHRLMMDDGLSTGWQHNHDRAIINGEPINLVVLPGSRSSEIKALLPIFTQTVNLLVKRGNQFNVTIPTLERHYQKVRDLTWDWAITPKITTSREEQIAAYQNADVALAASGTVTLELALAGIPAISCYKVDALMKLAAPLITTWSAALPNLIADEPVIAEYYNEFVRAALLARSIEKLAEPNGNSRLAVQNGYQKVRDAMTINQSPSVRAAEIIGKILASK